MWRILLFFHVRRSERRRLVVAFSVPVVLCIGLIVIHSAAVNTSRESIHWGNVLDSIQQYETIQRWAVLDSVRELSSFHPDTASISTWVKYGLPVASQARLNSYLNSGGHIYNGRGIVRFALEDTAWIRIISPKLLSRSRKEYSRSRASRWAENERIGDIVVDVNHASDSLLSELHVPSWTREKWVRCLSHGRTFGSILELTSVLQLDSNWLSAHLSQLNIEEGQNRLVVDVNEIDSSTLVGACICSPWSASKWIRYRTRLGGLASLVQLEEVGLNGDEWKRLQFVKLEFDKIEKRDLNQLDIGTLRAHPYIGWEMAKVIDYYRTRVRPIESVEELRGLQGVDTTDIIRLQYYFN